MTKLFAYLNVLLVLEKDFSILNISDYEWAAYYRPSFSIYCGQIKSIFLSLIYNPRPLKKKQFFFLYCKLYIIIKNLNLLWLWFPKHKLELYFRKFCITIYGMCLFNLSSTEHNSWKSLHMCLSFGAFHLFFCL